MPKPPTNQRPQINQRNSAGWSWPRLLPIHEQQARTSKDSHSSTRPSKEPLVVEVVVEDNGEGRSSSVMAEHHSVQVPKANSGDSDILQGSSVTRAPIADLMNGKNGPSEVPLLRSNDRSAPRKASRTTIDTAEEPAQGTVGSIISQFSSRSGRPSISESEALPESVVREPTGDNLEARDKADVDASRRGKITKEPNEQLSRDKDLQISPSATDETGKERHAPVEEAGTDASAKSRAASIGTKTPSLSFQGDFSQRHEAKDVADGGSSVTFQLDTDSIKRRGTKSSTITARGDEGVASGSLNEEATKIFADHHQSGIPLEEKPETPPTTPAQSAMDRVSAPTDPIPYYATPKITVHRPTDSSQSDISGPRTIDQVLAKEREAQPSAESTEEAPTAPVSSFMPRLLDTPTGTGVHKIVKVRKRSLYLRKARNIAARQTILNMTLGRQLASPTKQALRQLANGETIVDEPQSFP